MTFDKRLLQQKSYDNARKTKIAYLPYIQFTTKQNRFLTLERSLSKILPVFISHNMYVLHDFIMHYDQ